MNNLVDDAWTLRSKADIRLPGKGNLSFYGARPVHLVITMIKWIQTSRLPMKKSLSHSPVSNYLVSTIRRDQALFVQKLID